MSEHSFLNKLRDKIERLALSIAALCLVLLMVLGFSDVFARYAFSASIVQREELFRVLLIIIFVLSLPMITFKHEHLDVDLLDFLFKKQWRRKLQFFIIDSIVAICCGVMAYWLYDKSLRISRPGREVVYEELGIQQSYFAQFFALVLAIVAIGMVYEAIKHLMALSDGSEDPLLTSIEHKETL